MQSKFQLCKKFSGKLVENAPIMAISTLHKLLISLRLPL
ncbi:MAG: hypothetical protein H6Q57_1489 [Geobacteraceae bacterium]|nr:hypothetical protein [Geobacteraceae bacterium]